MTESKEFVSFEVRVSQPYVAPKALPSFDVWMITVLGGEASSVSRRFVAGGFSTVETALQLAEATDLIYHRGYQAGKREAGYEPS